MRRPPSGARPGGPAGRPAESSPCCGLFLRPPRGGHQGGSLCLRPALHTGLAHVRVPPSCCRPWCALAPRRRATRLPRALREWGGSRLEAGGVQQRLPRQWRPPLGVAALPRGGRPPVPGGGGAGPPPPWPASGCLRAKGREGGGEQGGERGPPRSTSPVPGRRSLVAAGGRPGGPGPGGSAVDGWGRIPLLPPSTFRALGRRAGPHPLARRSPCCRRLKAWCRLVGVGREGRQVLRVAVRVSG